MRFSRINRAAAGLSRVCALVLFISCAPAHTFVTTPMTCVERHGEKECDRLRRDMWRAASEGRLDIVRASILAGASVDSADANGITALQWALQGRHREVAEFLIRQGADLNLKNMWEGDALTAALRQDDFEMASRLIEAGADPGRVNEDGSSFLTWAASAGVSDLVKQILIARAKDGVSARELRLAFVNARNYSHPHVMELLLEHGAEPPPDDLSLIDENLPYVPKDLTDCFATLNRILSEEDREELRNDNSEAWQKWISFGTFLRNEWGLWSNSRLSLYFQKAGLDDPEHMSGEVMVAYKAWLRDEPYDLQASIDETVSFQQEVFRGPDEFVEAIESGDVDTVRRSIDEATDVDQPYFLDGAWWTPLELAIYEGNEEMIRALLDAGANPSREGTLRRVPLALAAELQDLAAIDLLLSYGADPFHMTPANDTPLGMAAATGNLAVLNRLLLVSGMRTHQPSLRDAVGAAAGTGHVEALRRLLEAGGTDPQTSKELATSGVWYAANGGYMETLKVLVEAGADVNAPAWDGESMLEHAYGEEIRNFLRSVGATEDASKPSQSPSDVE